MTLSEVYGDVYLNIEDSTVSGSVYGGGSIAIVYGDIEVNISNSTIGGNIYGGGDGATTPSTITLYKPIESYTELTATGTDPSVSIGKFTWTNDDGILEYFAGIYDGTNKVVYNEDGTTTSFDTIVETYGDEAQEVIDTYGTSKLVYSADVDNLGMVDGNITMTLTNVTLGSSAVVYGGGNNGTTNGSTDITITGTDFATLYGGGNSGDVKGDCSVEVTDSTIETIYGGSNEGNAGGDSTVIINSGTFDNIFGGGNLGYVTGDTKVEVGNEEDLGITVTGLVYGGGRGYDEDDDGDASDFTTVYGTSEVTIQGINTNVENYGSTKLGGVAGEVNVTFLNYWTGNGTAKYKTMNGIDRATTVTFTNSYVLLENENEDGELEGIQAIENLIIPDGSGLKISADGEISGNFEGGGDLYLDSRVCLRVGGNLSGETTMVLNPVIESNENLIRGGIELPYMVVSGTVEDGANLISGSARYEILNQVVGDETYFYIDGDVEITSEIDVTSVNAINKIYTGEIEGTSDIFIYGHGTVTTEITIEWDVSTSDEEPDKYENIERKFAINSSSTNIGTTIPAGTSMALVYDGEYYFYYVEEDATEIALAKFTNADGESFEEVSDFSTAEGVTSEVNETTNFSEYEYTETYRIILDFADSTSQIPSGYYYTTMELDDDENSLEDEKIESATNVVYVYNREYSYDYELNKSTYVNNETIKITGTLSLSSTLNEMEQSSKDLYIRVKLIDSEGNAINYPDGTTVLVNDVEGSVSGQNASGIIIEGLTNDEISQEVNVEINMENVLAQNRISVGDYTVQIEFVLAENGTLDSSAQETESTDISVISYGTSTSDDDSYSDSDYGLKASIDTSEDNNVQLIEVGSEESKSIKLSYNTDVLENAYIKITKVEKTGEFAYEESDSASEISTYIGDTGLDGDTEYVLEGTGSVDVTAVFGSEVEEGTYRIYFELYDQYDNKLTEDFIGFIVK